MVKDLAEMKGGKSSSSGLLDRSRGKGGGV